MLHVLLILLYDTCRILYACARCMFHVVFQVAAINDFAAHQPCALGTSSLARAATRHRRRGRPASAAAAFDLDGPSRPSASPHAASARPGSLRAPLPVVGLPHANWTALQKTEICSAHNLQCDMRVCFIRRDKWHAACEVARGVNVRSRRHLTRSQARRAAFASGAMRCPVSSFAQRTTATDGSGEAPQLRRNPLLHAFLVPIRGP